MIKILVQSVYTDGAPFQLEWQAGEQEWLLKHGRGEVEMDEYNNINVYAIFDGTNEMYATEYCLLFTRKKITNSSLEQVEWNRAGLLNCLRP